jgi:hypothetical protein
MLSTTEPLFSRLFTPLYCTNPSILFSRPSSSSFSPENRTSLTSCCQPPPSRRRPASCAPSAPPGPCVARGGGGHLCVALAYRMISGQHYCFHPLTDFSPPSFPPFLPYRTLLTSCCQPPQSQPPLVSRAPSAPPAPSPCSTTQGPCHTAWTTSWTKTRIMLLQSTPVCWVVLGMGCWRTCLQL